MDEILTYTNNLGQIRTGSKGREEVFHTSLISKNCTHTITTIQ